MTLSYLSSLAVIKNGIERNELEVPKTIIKDLGVMEKIINDEMTGEFTYTDPDYDSKMDIAWSPGEWRFTQRNQEPVKIRAGRRENLGLAGGEIFLFEGRKISIDDFNIDLEEKKIKFYGKCSSVKTYCGRDFKSTFSFIKFHGRDAMKVNSELIGEFGVKKAREKIFSRAGFEWMTVNFGAESDSDSSIDYEDELESYRDWDASHSDVYFGDELLSDQIEIGDGEECEEALGVNYGVEQELYDSEIDIERFGDELESITSEIDTKSFVVVDMEERYGEQSSKAEMSEDVQGVIEEVAGATKLASFNAAENGYDMMFEGWGTMCIFVLIFAYLCS